ncbi:uncharacterized protein BJ212DRAFT_1485094 [Suillus subaureus]|uniref:Uncharacterized protein n=1 Tax=Suillus subaureus TaxID=48587 RepID=A0A9P7J8S0_9AGAM|nr:uncharacterized protein BJ212DRAFT_1485094 [Suillus subaureus]KAG1808438.1 hypothetical protein BJ212DRAFT_1485094 [Suillus subaureus]
MKVFPMMIKEQTFSLSELVTIVELLRNQLFLTHAHAEAGTDLPNHLEEVLASQISQAGLSISSESSNSPGDMSEGGGKFLLHSVSDTSSLTSVTTEVNVAPSITITAAAGAAPPTTVAAPHGSTFASVCWYIITVGCETSVFQGWHNVHLHVIGILGACFSQYSSHAGADEAYAQALQDSTVQELPL